MMSLIDFSGHALLAAFGFAVLSFILFVIAITGKRWRNRDPREHQAKWSKIAVIVAGLGFIAHLAYLITRWIAAGRIPIANMFEFLTFLALMVSGAFLVVFALYRTSILGLFTQPVIFLLLAFAAVFPSEIQPLIPSLKSHWLYIHVSLAALGEAFFAVGFAVGLMYLIRVTDYADRKRGGKSRFGIEFTLWAVFAVIGFVAVTMTFSDMGYSAEFSHPVKEQDALGNWETVTTQVEYQLPPIVAPHAYTVIHAGDFFGKPFVGVEAPDWLRGVAAARKLNTLIWSVLAGTVLYALFRLIARKPLGAVLQRVIGDIDPDDLDEIGYRSIAIGYPIFALGGLVFASIWAHEAWGRFWGWDPKETWALIMFLFYTFYLHLRLSRGWQGLKSAWLAVIGFLVVMFTLVGVNLLIAGLHSYAGV
jgi:ABC-type transport system involved in cytochrome c biogenesis permease subunit